MTGPRRRGRRRIHAWTRVVRNGVIVRGQVDPKVGVWPEDDPDAPGWEERAEERARELLSNRLPDWETPQPRNTGGKALAQGNNTGGIILMPFNALQKQVHDWVNQQNIPKEGSQFTMGWDGIDKLTTFLNDTLYENYSQQCRALTSGYQESGTQRQTQQVDSEVQDRR